MNNFMENIEDDSMNPYCYRVENGKRKPCKFWKLFINSNQERFGTCLLYHVTDYETGCMTDMLWDQVRLNDCAEDFDDVPQFFDLWIRYKGIK